MNWNVGRQMGFYLGWDRGWKCLVFGWSVDYLPSVIAEHTITIGLNGFHHWYAGGA